MANEFHSLAVSSLVAFLYPVSMYIWPGALTSDRNHPKTIKRNFVSVLGASFIASKVMTIFLNWHDTSTKTVFQYINLHTYQSDWDLFLYCVLYPLLHVMILFIGPIINDCGLFIQTYLVAFKSNPVTFSIQLILLQLKQLTQIVLIRNLVVAPLTEEFIFRGIMLSVLTPFWSKGTSALVSSFLFGLMHAHHFFRTLLLYGKLNRDDAFKTIFQCIYTTLFGLYASMAYLRSGNLITPILLHWFCNLNGLPCFQTIATNRIHMFITMAGFIIWLCFLIPLFRASL
ncbi:CAAX prenyl protease [Blomia tropicalis]|nr:CAAX prenyl protease [Blomia tropicalis]